VAPNSSKKMFKNQNKTKTFIILREKVFKKFFVEKMYTVGLMKIFCLMTALYFSSDFKTIFRLKCKNFKKCKKIKKKQERKLTSASRSLYTLAVIIIKFKNTKNDIPNSIR